MNISIEQLRALNNPNIIDIRTIENYNNNHIPGAKNIPYNNWLLDPSKYLSKSEEYYIYCKHGKTAEGLCRILQSSGYNVHNIIGGYEAWVLRK